MAPSLAILFGAAFTVAVCLAMGSLWLRLVPLPLSRIEHYLFSLLCGAAALSGIVFLLCSAHIAYHGALAIVGIAAVVGQALSPAPTNQKPNQSRPSRLWQILPPTLFVLFAVIYLFNAMSPERSPDGVVYHLWLPQSYLRAHAFVRFESYYANMPQGLEMLFLFALAFGQNSSAVLVHYAFLLAWPLLIACYGRRANIPNAAIGAALFVFLCPVVAITGTSAYNDIAAAAVTFAVFYLLQLWVAEQRTGLLLTAGLLCGFGYSIKYTAGIALLYALGIVIWQRRLTSLRPALLLCLCAAALIVPWTAKSWIWTGDPIAPFANRLFPNPSFHISFEDDWRHNLQHYEVKSLREFPSELMIHGVTLGGVLGPLFFAAPMALLALRRPVGRRILLAALVFLLPYPANIGTRFLLPALPFISLAMAMAFETVPMLLIVIVILDAVAAWPSVVSYYSTDGTWRITGFPFRQALRLEPEDAFLSRESPDYVVARMIEQLVPPGKRIFSFSTTGRAYTHRDVMTSYESAPGEKYRDLLWVPFVKYWQPDRDLEYSFPMTTVRRLRLTQTAVTKVMWSINELRVSANGVEVPRSSAWRITARPNPWDVQLAFDNNPVTRWRTWQKATPGMYVEIDFGKPVSVDAMDIQCDTDEDETRGRLDGMRSDSAQWSKLSDAPKETVIPIDVNLRAEGTAELQRHGFDYLLVSGSAFGSDDLYDNRNLWNLKLIGERDLTRLYRIGQ